MPETILVVDDEETVQNRLAGVMRDEGYDVVTVASAPRIGDQKPLEVTE
jgi:CheY-like chemotaxis protein